MNNSKKIFDTLNLLKGKNIKQSISTEISVNENIGENDVDIDSVFIKFFSSFGKQLLNFIDQCKPFEDVDFSLSSNL